MYNRIECIKTALIVAGIFILAFSAEWWADLILAAI